MEHHMPAQAPDKGREDTAASLALAIKLTNLVGAEGQWLVARGLDEAAVDAILTNGAVIALATVYQATSFHDEEGMIGTLRGELRACRLRISH
jgi:hypothetical protein